MGILRLKQYGVKFLNDSSKYRLVTGKQHEIHTANDNGAKYSTAILNR